MADTINDYMYSALGVLGHTGPSIQDRLYSYWNGKSTLGLEASILDHKMNFLSSFAGESVQEQEIAWMKTKIGFPGNIDGYQDVGYWFWSNGGQA